jgi:ABC-type uncharacterized transport system auxiliary subunit
MKPFLYIITLILLFLSCGKVPIKQYFILNYLPSSERNRLSQGPYPFTLRIQELNIEEAYNRPQIVYRKSPFSIQYYVYRVWAVKPTRMLTDLIYKHFLTSNLVGTIVRRFDEGQKPDYELSGMIEAIEEYDSEELWFAHLAVRFQLVRVSDGRIIYTRRFDNRKRVFQHEPEYVVREMSSLMEFIMTQVIHDLDVKFAGEYGLKVPAILDTITPAAPSDSTITGVSE